MRHWEICDRGMVRNDNQDAVRVLELTDAQNDEFLAAIVCDGMGGAKAGSVASKMAVDCFVNTFLDNFSDMGDSRGLIEDTVYDANAAIYEKSGSDEQFAGMGTTMVTAIVGKSRALIGNIGDSRTYLIRGGVMRQVTKDHSLVQDMVDRGEISLADAWLHPRRNYITRALGTERETQCDFYDIGLESGDMLLMCTDGLSGVLNQQEILFELIYGDNKETAVERLLDITISRGAPDNVTAVLISIQ